MVRDAILSTLLQCYVSRLNAWHKFRLFPVTQEAFFINFLMHMGWPTNVVSIVIFIILHKEGYMRNVAYSAHFKNKLVSVKVEHNFN